MTALFATTLVDSTFNIHEINALSFYNPFHTSEYISYRRAQGFLPWILINSNNQTKNIYCLAFMKTGRLRRLLDIPSMPDVSADDPFWKNLMDFCSNKGVSDLLVSSFGSQGGTIPQLDYEHNRKNRYEYVLNLKHADILKNMSKLHVRKIKQAQKTGVKIRCSCDNAAVENHVRLISASMKRRKDRGENISTKVPLENMYQLVHSGAGKIFQALVGNQEISTNLILVSDKAGYNHSGGTNLEGMSCGASHFLFYEIACALRSEGKEIFNLGGISDPDLESGLARFKTGFGTKRIKLESVRVKPSSIASSLLYRFLSSIKDN